MRRHRGCRCACVRAWSRPGLVATGGRSSPVADVKLPLQKHLSVVPAWRWPLARESCCPAGACLQPAVAKPLGQLHRNRLASLSTHASSRRGAAAALCRARQAAAPAAAARLSQRGGRGRTRLGLPCPTPALIPAAKHLQRLLASPRVVQLGRQCLARAQRLLGRAGRVRGLRAARLRATLGRGRRRARGRQRRVGRRRALRGRLRGAGAVTQRAGARRLSTGSHKES